MVQGADGVGVSWIVSRGDENLAPFRISFYRSKGVVHELKYKVVTCLSPPYP